jgi:hypothetical protein
LDESMSAESLASQGWSERSSVRSVKPRLVSIFKLIS